MQSYLFKHMETHGHTRGNSNLRTGGITSMIDRHSFPPDFLWGSATSAFQIEGAAKEGGRGPSVWDDFVQRFPGKITDGSNGDRAIDFYNQYKEDVQTMKRMGFESFRMSISWSRILPSGRLSGGVNREGIKFYNDLINELLANGITPFVTLFHWDLPQNLSGQYGGFLNSEIVSDFCDFADVCFWEFGDRVKHWVTLNEPWVYTVFGWVTGEMPPGRGATSALSSEKLGTSLIFHRFLNTRLSKQNEGGNPGTEPYIVAHNLLLAHANAVDLYRKTYKEAQKGEIGITLVTDWFEPYSNSKADCDAALRQLDFVLGWYMDPLVNGDYPTTMKTLVGDRLPKFSETDARKVRGSYDFIGMNYYYGVFVQDLPSNGTEVPNYLTDSQVLLTSERNGIPIGSPIGDTGYSTYAKGFYDLMMYIKCKYEDPAIYITENGVTMADDVTLTIKEAVLDPFRKEFFIDHLRYLLASINDGVNVKGYFAWSLMDNFEWHSGYTSRFGIMYVDYKDPHLSRYPKDSGKWFMNFLNKHAIATLKRARNDYEEEVPLTPETGGKKMALMGTPKGSQ